MRPDRIAAIILLTLLLSVQIQIADGYEESANTRSGTTIYVDVNGNGDYDNIQDAINVSSAGDTIRVYDGVYPGIVRLNRSISLIGNGTQNTFLRFNDYMNLISISVPDVTVKYLTIEVAMLNSYAINAYDADDLVVDSCLIRNSPMGIRIGRTPDFNVRNTTIQTTHESFNIYDSGRGNIEGCDIEVTDTNIAIQIKAPSIKMGNNTIRGGTFYIYGEPDISYYDIDDSNTIDGVSIFCRSRIEYVVVPEDSPLVLLGRCRNIYIEDFEKDGGFYQYYFSDCEGIYINRSTFSNPIFQIIYCDKSDNINILNCTFRGFVQTNFCSRVTLRDNHFRDTYSATLLSGNSLNVTDNTFENCSSRSLYIDGNMYQSEENLFTVERNIINNSSGLYCRRINKLHLNDNNIKNCTQGIRIEYGNYFEAQGNSVCDADIGYLIQCSSSNIAPVSTFMNNHVKRASVGLSVSGRVQVEKFRVESITETAIEVRYKVYKIANCTFEDMVCPAITIENGANSSFYNITFKNSSIGLKLKDTKDNLFVGNKFIDNDVDVESVNGDNTWHLLLPIGGNYWSDYMGSDRKWGRYQNQGGSDGFGDTPHMISGDNSDRYPIFIDTVDPVADAGDDVEIGEGSVLHFNGIGGSSDDQLVVDYLWEFQYGGEEKRIHHGEFDFKFDLPGYYTVLLTVFDFGGNSDQDERIIKVIDLIPPVAITQGDMTILQGETAIFNATASFDNGTINSYTWNFSYNNADVYLYGPTPSFSFITPGLYRINIKVSDSSGNYGFSDFFLNVIDNEKPLADAGDDIEILNGEIAFFDGSDSFDNGEIKTLEWTVVYNNKQISIEGESTSFNFLIPGFYNVTLIVEDAYGNIGSDHLLVTVVDTQDPIAMVEGSTTVLEGEGLLLNGLGSTDNGKIIRYLWTFLDESYREIQGPYLNYSFSVKGEHVVTLTVYDQWNNSDTINITVNFLDTTPPIARAGEDLTIAIGSTIPLDGSRSVDDGTITIWEWRFHYEGAAKELQGEHVNFTFDVEGIYTITLSILDQSGNYADDDIVVTVTDMGWLTGNVVDENGDPILGADVVVISSYGDEYRTKTNYNGSFILAIPQSTLYWTITMPDLKTVEGTIKGKALDTISIDTIEMSTEKDIRSNTPIFLILLAVILLVTIVALLFFLIKNPKQEQEVSNIPPEGEIVNEYEGAEPPSEEQANIDPLESSEPMISDIGGDIFGDYSMPSMGPIDPEAPTTEDPKYDPLQSVNTISEDINEE